MRKLTYFDVPALGEPIRLLLAYSEKDFENVKISMYDWADYKQNFPFGQVPIYEEDGRVINQSIAIMRYLGKQCGLCGSNDWEDMEIDAMAENIRDLKIKFIYAHFEKSASRQKHLRNILLNETVPYYLKRFEEIAEKNGGYLAVNNKLTWVDFYWAGVVNYLSWAFKMDISGCNPNLKAVQDHVLCLPQVQKWYEENPICEKAVKEWIEFSSTPSLP